MRIQYYFKYTKYLSDANNGNTYGGGNWASHIKKILEEHGFFYISGHIRIIN